MQHHIDFEQSEEQTNRKELTLAFPEELSLAFDSLCANTLTQWKTAETTLWGGDAKEAIARKKNRRKKNRKKAKGEGDVPGQDCNGCDRAQDAGGSERADDLSDGEFERLIADFELRLTKQSLAVTRLKPNVSAAWLAEVRMQTTTN